MTLLSSYGDINGHRKILNEFYSRLRVAVNVFDEKNFPLMPILPSLCMSAFRQTVSGLTKLYAQVNNNDQDVVCALCATPES